MTVCYEKNKVHALKWRENNYELWKKLNRNYKANHYTIWKDYLKTCRDFRKLTPEIFQ